MDTTQRIVIGAVSVVFLAAYLAWRWHRAGKWVEAREAAVDEARRYLEGMRQDPRWHALEAHVRANFPLGADSDPSAFVVHKIAVVDDRGQMYRPETRDGPTRVVALLARREPATQLYVSMDLRTGELRQDPAPYGWTYFGPYR